VRPLPLAIVGLEGPFHCCRPAPERTGPPMGTASLGKVASLHRSGLSCQPADLGRLPEPLSRLPPCDTFTRFDPRRPPAFPGSRNRRFSTGVEISVQKGLCRKAFSAAGFGLFIRY
jgi:hypothetical protein